MNNRYEKSGRYTAKLFGCLLSFLDVILILIRYFYVTIFVLFESGVMLSLYVHRSSSSKKSFLFKLNNYLIKSIVFMMETSLGRQFYIFILFPTSFFLAIKYKSILLFVFLITPLLNIFALPFVFLLFAWQNKETFFVCNIELICSLF